MVSAKSQRNKGELMSELITIKAHRNRHVVVTWFGNCSYRRLKVTYEVRKIVCPLCLHELEDAQYLGSKVFALDRHAIDYVRDSWMPLFEDGHEVWLISDKG